MIIKKTLLLEYENKWVALNKNKTKIVFAGDTIEELDKKIRDSKTSNLSILKVPPFNLRFSL